MADNTQINPGTGGDIIATDDLTTVNLNPVSGVKAQRMKVGFGDDGQFRDVTDLVPLPVELHSDSGEEFGTYNDPIITKTDIDTVAGAPRVVTADGVELTSIADEFGDPINTTGRALNTFITNQNPLSTVTPPISDPIYTGNLGAIGSKLQVEDTLGYKYAVFSFNYVTAPTLSTQFFVSTSDLASNTNGINNFAAMGYMKVDATASPQEGLTPVAITPVVNAYYIMPIGVARKIKVQVTAYTSGNMQASVRLTNTFDANKYQTTAFGDGIYTNTPTTLMQLIANIPYLNNTVSNDRWRSILNAKNDTGTGVAAVGLVAQLDETTPTAITENQFGNVRMSPNRALQVETRPSTITGYTATVRNLSLAATATDFVTITGSASKTVKVTRIKISTTQTTAGLNEIVLLKRSTANTAGTSAAMTAVPYDANNAAATATCLSYTANPTTGTLVANMDIPKIPAPAPATGAPIEYVWDFTKEFVQPPVLRGTAQVLALNFNGAAIPTGLVVNATIEWVEADG
jgi:hypothetical protein